MQWDLPHFKLRTHPQWTLVTWGFHYTCIWIPYLFPNQSSLLWVIIIMNPRIINNDLLAKSGKWSLFDKVYISVSHTWKKPPLLVLNMRTAHGISLESWGSSFAFRILHYLDNFPETKVFGSTRVHCRPSASNKHDWLIEYIWGDEEEGKEDPPCPLRPLLLLVVRGRLQIREDAGKQADELCQDHHHGTQQFPPRGTSTDHDESTQSKLEIWNLSFLQVCKDEGVTWWRTGWECWSW